METAEATRVPLGPARVQAHAGAPAGCALAGCRAEAPVVVLHTPEAGHRKLKGPARVSPIAQANSGLRWHCPQRGVSALELPLEELEGASGRWHLHPGTHQVRM
jgi:hypothetical protein